MDKIDIRDLRLGNWVRITEPDNFAGAMVKISSLSNQEGAYFAVTVEDPEYGYFTREVFCEDIEPIPLTAEILKGNNFRRYDMDYQISDDLFISFYKSKEGFSLFTQDSLENDVYLHYINYVHQLQNILIDLGIDKEITILKYKIMTQEKIKITDNKFENNGVVYDCWYAIKKDIELILDEAKKSHPDFDKIYIVDSIKPKEINVYFDGESKPVFGMIVYIIDYKDYSGGRLACGGYYPIGEKTVNVHPYQYSICW